MTGATFQIEKSLTDIKTLLKAQVIVIPIFSLESNTLYIINFSLNQLKQKECFWSVLSCIFEQNNNNNNIICKVSKQSIKQ